MHFSSSAILFIPMGGDILVSEQVFPNSSSVSILQMFGLLGSLLCFFLVGQIISLGSALICLLPEKTLLVFRAVSFQHLAPELPQFDQSKQENECENH